MLVFGNSQGNTSDTRAVSGPVGSLTSCLCQCQCQTGNPVRLRSHKCERPRRVSPSCLCHNSGDPEGHPYGYDSNKKLTYILPIACTQHLINHIITYHTCHNYVKSCYNISNHNILYHVILNHKNYVIRAKAIASTY